MPSNRAKASNSKTMDDWFSQVKKVYDENDFHTKPYHVFNCDETGMQCDLGKLKLICRKGLSNPKRLCNSNQKKMYTVLACCNEFGSFLPVHIMFRGKRLMANWVKGGPANATYSTSKSGWMEGDQFSEWFNKTFIPHCNKLAGSKILFLGGHASHLTIELVEKAKANNIILFKLPAHTSHLIQPLDVGVFKTTKLKWKEILNAHIKTTGFRDISNDVFTKLMVKVTEKGMLPENARSGFNASGIFPLDRAKITKENWSWVILLNKWKKRY